MRTSVASLIHKTIALCAAFALACSMAPLAWADDGSAATAAGIAAGNAAEPDGAEGAEGTVASNAQDAPEASAQSADAKAVGSSAGPGTTVSIQVYCSSYPLVWDLNDAGSADETKASWGNKPAAWPTEGSPGSAVGKCDGYVPWTDDANPGSEPSRLGFNFMGWSTKPDIAVEGTGKLDALVIPKDAPIVEGDDGVKRITLYALWAPVEYSVVFDLTKNPEDASAVPSFSWTTGKGTFSDLGGGRYRLSGVTLEDYDPQSGLIEIATPARGTGGYRFLSWAEPESQQDPAVAVMKSGSAKWFVNPVALPHYDYEPVLTARWALSFDVDVPSQVTFDQYDSLEVEGNLTDTTSKDAIDEESSDLHDKGKLAHFCSQSTASDYKIVALKSVKQPTAEKVLTTSDSSKASPEEVLGGTDEKGVEHEGEKLLSLFAQGATSESQGVHFRLDDAIDMDDSSRYGAFTIPKQTKSYSDTDYSRDDEKRLYVSYRLNLDNKVDGATEPNHGLVVPENVQEGDRTPIAEVSYEFAVADAGIAYGDPSDSSPFKPTGPDGDFYLYLTEAQATTVSTDNLKMRAGYYGASTIKKAAVDISANGVSSKYYEVFDNIMDQDIKFKAKWRNVDGHNATVAGGGTDTQGEAIGKILDTAYEYDIRIVGLLQDYTTTSRSADAPTAGITFQFAENGLTYFYRWNNLGANNTGWKDSELRARMNSADWEDPSTMEFGDQAAEGTIWSRAPKVIQDNIQPVYKWTHNSWGNNTLGVSSTRDQMFLASYAEMVASTSTYFTNSEWTAAYNTSWVQNEGVKGTAYQYWKNQNVSGTGTNKSTIKKCQNSAAPTDSDWAAWGWWERTVRPGNQTFFNSVRNDGYMPNYGSPERNSLIAPCFCF